MLIRLLPKSTNDFKKTFRLVTRFITSHVSSGACGSYDEHTEHSHLGKNKHKKQNKKTHTHLVLSQFSIVQIFGQKSFLCVCDTG